MDSVQPLKVLLCPNLECRTPLGIHNDGVLILGSVRVYRSISFDCGSCGYTFHWEIRQPPPASLAGYSNPVTVTRDGARLRRKP